MAKKKENLKDLRETELGKRLALLSENMRVLKFKAEGSKSKNVKELGTFRKEIARILTEINRRESVEKK